MSEKGQPELDATPPLSSWVRTLNLDEGAGSVLDAAVPGMDLAELEADADCWLPQEDPAYRKLLTKLVWDDFLDKDDDGRLVNSPFLQLFKYGTLACRHDIFYARYGLSQPWTLLAARELVAPARALAEAGDPGGALETADWDALVDRTIDPSSGASSRQKTRGTVAGVLVQLGSLERVGRALVARRASPDPMAFAWTVYWELQARGLTSRGLADAASTSAAAWVFAPAAAAAVAALEEASRRGLFNAREDDGGPVIELVANPDLARLTRAPKRNG